MGATYYTFAAVLQYHPYLMRTPARWVQTFTVDGSNVILCNRRSAAVLHNILCCCKTTANLYTDYFYYGLLFFVNNSTDKYLDTGALLLPLLLPSLPAWRRELCWCGSSASTRQATARTRQTIDARHKCLALALAQALTACTAWQRRALPTSALHIVIEQRIFHPSHAVEVSVAAPTFVNGVVRGTKYVVLEETVIARHAGHGSMFVCA